MGVGAVSSNTERFCTLARGYSRMHKQSLIFINDLSHFLTSNNQSWESLKIDWERVLDEVATSKVLSLMMTLSDKGIFLAANSSVPELEAITPDGRKLISLQERQAFRNEVIEVIREEWSAYVYRMHSTGQLQIK